MASDRRDPRSETTPAKRLKLGQDEEIQFGYFSPSPSLVIPIMPCRRGGVFSYSTFGALPLRGRAKFEVKIVKTLKHFASIGLMKVKKNASDCITPRKTSSEQGRYYTYYWHNLNDIHEGDHYGVKMEYWSSL